MRGGLPVGSTDWLVVWIWAAPVALGTLTLDPVKQDHSRHTYHTMIQMAIAGVSLGLSVTRVIGCK